MSDLTREQQARELREALIDDMEGRKRYDRDDLDDEIKRAWDAEWDAIILKHILDTERATLERVILVQCSKCNARDQYGEAVVEVGQWMHQHIRSLTWTLCDAGRIQAYLKTKEIPS